MVMPARAVNVSVLELLFRRGADADHFYIEVQRLVGKRMVAVKRHHIAHHGGDDEHSRPSSVCARNCIPLRISPEP